MACSPPGSSVHGILQTRILEWVAIPFSRASFWPKVSRIAGKFFTIWATMEALHFSNTQMHILLPLCSWPRPNCLFEILTCPSHWNLKVNWAKWKYWFIGHPPNVTEVTSSLSSVQFSSVSHVQLFATPWTTAGQASLSITNSWSLLRLTSIKSVMPSSYLILSHSLLLPPSIFPSIRVFSNESGLCIRWPKYWSFSFNISPFNEHPGLISFRMDSLDLLEVQGTLKSLLQHHSSKASILQCSAFFIVWLSHPYMTTGKTIALTRQTLLAK